MSKCANALLMRRIAAALIDGLWSLRTLHQQSGMAEDERTIALKRTEVVAIGSQADVTTAMRVMPRTPRRSAAWGSKCPIRSGNSVRVSNAISA